MYFNIQVLLILAHVAIRLDSVSLVLVRRALAFLKNLLDLFAVKNESLDAINICICTYPRCRPNKSTGNTPSSQPGNATKKQCAAGHQLRSVLSAALVQDEPIAEEGTGLAPY